jgi:hypothetical protein
MSRLLTLIVATAITVTAFVTPALASAPKATAHIVADPDSVMVNSPTTLTGRHFEANKRITLAECAERNWIAPQDPCDTTGTIKVKTNVKGQFTAKFTVRTCPEATTPGTEQTCYIGELTPTGIDTVALVGAVAVTVTGP